MYNKLNQTITKAYTTVPIYITLAQKHNINLTEDIQIQSPQELLRTLPLVEKEDYLSDCENGISSHYMLDLMRDELLISQTSGSTGKCLNIYCNEEDSKNSMLPLWIARNRRYGIKSNDKVCFFYTVTNQVDEFDNDGVKYQTKGNALGFYKMNLTEDKIVTIHKMMTEYQPKWLMLNSCINITFKVYIYRKSNIVVIIYCCLCIFFYMHEQ